MGQPTNAIPQAVRPNGIACGAIYRSSRPIGSYLRWVASREFSSTGPEARNENVIRGCLKGLPAKALTCLPRFLRVLVSATGSRKLQNPNQISPPFSPPKPSSHPSRRLPPADNRHRHGRRRVAPGAGALRDEAPAPAPRAAHRHRRPRRSQPQAPVGDRQQPPPRR